MRLFDLGGQLQFLATHRFFFAQVNAHIPLSLSSFIPTFPSPSLPSRTQHSHPTTASHSQPKAVDAGSTVFALTCDLDRTKREGIKADRLPYFLRTVRVHAPRARVVLVSYQDQAHYSGPL